MPHPTRQPCATPARALALLAVLALPLASTPLHAQRTRLRDRIAARAGQGEADDDAGSRQPSTLVPTWRDVAYGDDPAQRLDVYRPGGRAAPSSSGGMPIVVMVHGGGWRRGDKAMSGVVDHKVGHWGDAGLLFVSVNYRLLPGAAPRAQAADVARALATVQRRAAEWGGDPDRVVLMGHSAGAHLVALVSTDPSLARAAGARAWAGTVSLDNATLDVVETMRAPHLKLYDDAFGSDTAAWRAASPIDQLRRAGHAPPPLLLVCSSRRRAPCRQAQAMRAEVARLGGTARVAPEPLTHAEINARLGLPGDYTAAVDDFLRAVHVLR